MLLVFVLVIASAFAVVVANIGRVKTGKPLVSLAPPPIDSSRRRMIRDFHRGIERMERRLAEARRRAAVLTPEQVLTGSQCDSGLALFRTRVAIMETISVNRHRVRYGHETRLYYDSLRRRVNGFYRMVDSTATGPDLDSMDREFERLIDRR